MKFLIGLILVLGSHFSFASDAVISLSNQPQVDRPPRYPDQGNRQEIYRNLELESRARYVNEAIAIKESGLRYVQNITDFEILTRYAFQNPNESYKNAVGAFIARYVGNFIYNSYSIPEAIYLEVRAQTIQNAQMIKQAAANFARDERDFLEIATTPIQNPSLGYIQMQSNFIGQNIFRFVSYNSSIDTVLRIESKTHYTSDAISVKQAGLNACRYYGDFHRLSQYAFANPSQGYRQAVNDFVIRNRHRCP